jgi:hypothetical protein
LPQLPQFFESVLPLKHEVGFELLGQARDVGVSHTQEPDGHVAPLGHAWPQLPQFAVESGFTHEVGLAADGQGRVSPVVGHVRTHDVFAALHVKEPFAGGLPVQVMHAP